jgi:Fe-Mn family superoxide dismutase
MNLSRRDALKTMGLAAAASLMPKVLFADAPAAPTTSGSAAPAAPVVPMSPFVLPALPYAYDALEPSLDAATMQLHHDKHHAAYVTNLNKAAATHPELGKSSVEDLLRKLDAVPADVRTVVRNHGGGHANHSLLWTSLKRDGARAPIGELSGAIDTAFGSFSAFGEKFNAAAMSVFGSGWAWLTYDAKTGLAIETSPNQDSPLTAGRVPLLGLDVWEHAYYLKYQNRRVEYVAAFAKVVDWDAISARYRDAKKG